MKKTILLSTALLIGTLLMAGPSWAEVPETINYQGKLTNGGVAVNGPLVMKFSLFDAATGGNLLWVEARDNFGAEDHRVIFTDGIYNVQLGSIEPFGEDLETIFDNSALYLQVNILDGTGGVTLEPRQKLSSTAFALRAKEAETLQGYNALYFTNASNIVTGMIDEDRIDKDIARDSDITWANLSDIPPGLDDGDDIGITSENDPQVGSIVLNQVPKWNGSSLDSSTISDYGGNVGVGVHYPNTRLEVAGGIKIADDSADCNSATAGSIRWTGSSFQGCNGSKWISFAFANIDRDVPTVRSNTGRIWMDRNLGATRVAMSFDDAEAYGDLYQWGRETDGHEKRNSPTTSTLSSTDNPGHGSFILIDDSPGDWRSPQNDNLWQGEQGINNPCPDGFRLPTATELDTERQSWGVSNYNSAGAFASPLKLVAAGYRYHRCGMVYEVGRIGHYWTSTVYIDCYGYYNARGLFFSSAEAYKTIYTNAYGNSVRCVED